MAQKLMGKKRGMVQIFDDQGKRIVCTVIEVEPNIVTQIKTKESDGYNAIQIGFDKIAVNDERTLAKRVNKPQLGSFKKAGIEPRRFLTEFRVEKTDQYTLGQEFGVGIFADVAYVDATATSKGKGFQGVIKRHHMAGGPAAHGSSFHRHGGSTGMRTTPGRVLPGQKMPGHMGNERVTVQNLKVIRVIEQDHVIVIEGQVPGPKNGLIYLSEAVKLKASGKSSKKK